MLSRSSVRCDPGSWKDRTSVGAQGPPTRRRCLFHNSGLPKGQEHPLPLPENRKMASQTITYSTVGNLQRNKISIMTFDSKAFKSRT